MGTVVVDPFLLQRYRPYILPHRHFPVFNSSSLFYSSLLIDLVRQLITDYEFKGCD